MSNPATSSLPDQAEEPVQALETRDGRVGPIVLVALLGVFVLVHTNLVLFTGLSNYYDGRRILQILLLSSVSLLLMASPSVRRGILDVVSELGLTPKIALVATAAVGVLSSVRAPLPSAGLREVALFTLLGVLAVAVCAGRRMLGRHFDLTITLALLAAGLIYATLFIILRRAHITLLGFESLSVHPQHFFYGWSNARFFGQIGLLVFPLLAAAPLLLHDRSRLARGGAWLVALGWWALIIEAGGRGSILFTVIAVAMVALLLGRLARAWAVAATVVLAGGSALWFFLSRLMHRLYAPESDGDVARRGLSPAVERAIERGASDNSRFAFWQDALEMIRSAPLLGVGPEHYAYHQQTLHTAAPHNVPLQVAAEWGVPAALVLGALTLWAGIAWTRKWRASNSEDLHTRALVPALSAAAVGAAMLGMVEGVIVPPASQVMIALVAGWMLAMYVRIPGRRDDEQRSRTRRPARQSGLGHAAVALLTLTLTATLVWSAGPYLWSPTQTLHEQIETHEFSELYPRFWIQGRLFDE